MLCLTDEIQDVSVILILPKMKAFEKCNLKIDYGIFFIIDEVTGQNKISTNDMYDKEQ